MRVMVMAIVTLLLAGCAGGGAGGGADAPAAPAGSQSPGGPGSPAAPAGPAGDPVGLIGMWTLAGTTGDDGSVLRIAPKSISLWRQGCTFLGDWRANTDGVFLATLLGGAGCQGLAGASVTWLHRAAGFRIDGDSRALLDATGATVARLLPGGRPAPNPNIASSEAEPPVVTAAARRDLAAAAPLPVGLTPAGRAAVVRRWQPSDGPASSFVAFAEDGTWSGSDGCNGLHGRWVAGAAGALLANSGAHLLAGCDNSAVDRWLIRAARAGLAGDVLVLLDVRGWELGRLHPA